MKSKFQIILALSLIVFFSIKGIGQNLSLTVNNVSCHGGNDGAISITQNWILNCGPGPYQYQLVSAAGSTTSPLTSNTSFVFNNLNAGFYTVNILANGQPCESVQSVINEPNPISIVGAINNVLCCGAAEGVISTITSGGTSPYVYFWTTNNGNIPMGQNSFPNIGAPINPFGLIAGSYHLQVTDANGCSDTATFTITENCFTPTLDSVVNTPCEGGSVFYTFNGGTGPYYSELYLNGLVCNSLGSEEEEQLSVNGLISGVYVLNLTDATGCSNFQQFNISSPTPISAQTNLSSPNCSDDMNGMINQTLTGGSGPLSYVWANGETTEDIMNVGAGIYSVTITDSLGCIILYSYTLTEPSQIVINGSINGNAIDLTVSGGTPGYTFSWSNGATTEDLSNLSSGTYSVTVTDALNCSISDTFTVDNAGLEHQQSIEFQVFPNPTDGMATLSSSSAGLGNTFYILDAYGRNVLEGKLTMQETNIDVQTLANGLYHLQIGTQRVQFIVAH
jgi:hypothetical protein